VGAEVATEVGAHLAAALGPLLDRVGGRIVGPAEAGPDDVAILWDGKPEVFVRLGQQPSGPDAPAATSAATSTQPSADLSDGLARLIADVEAELGGSLSSLGRPEKQRAVRLLEERGAFEMRRSAETVAEALGVTRFTVYNYLNRGRDPRA
jgi:hypothetical protein